MKENKSEIGIIGLGVMGKGLARNFDSQDIKTSVYNVPLEGEEEVTAVFVKEFSDCTFYGAKNLEDFVESLSIPRKVLLMIKAGEPVDDMIDKLIPHLDKGDCIIDAGNSFYKDTERRYIALSEKGIHFVGMGISGGEEGALKGPSMMPAGSEESKQLVLPLLEKIAASTPGYPCVSWIGEGGAGHFIKMVHNGIEYAEMQLIAEMYDICKNGLSLTNSEVADLWEELFIGFHEGFLLKISIEILRKKSGEEYILDTILDVAGHNGTGMWTSLTALELGVAVPTITAAFNQRVISSFKDIRMRLSGELLRLKNVLEVDIMKPLLADAFLCARLIAHAEGFHLIKVASDKYGWGIAQASVAEIWKGGCIIRSKMLDLIATSFAEYQEVEEKELDHLFSSALFMSILSTKSIYTSSLITTCSMGTNIAIPCISASFNYLRSMVSAELPINMIQAQRDYFGAHTYKRIDNPDVSIHTNWT